MKIVLKEGKKDKYKEICSFVSYLKKQGIDKDEFLDMLDKCWDEELEELFNTKINISGNSLDLGGAGEVLSLLGI